MSLFARQALLRPGWIAVEGDGERVSYGALLARSSRLARRLRDLGVGPRPWSGCAWSGASPRWWRCWRLAGGRQLCGAGPVLSVPRLRYLVARQRGAWCCATAAMAARLSGAGGRRARAAPFARSRGPDAAAAAAATLPSPARRIPQPRLCHLYLRLHRPAQTRRRQSSRVARTIRLAESGVMVLGRTDRVLLKTSLGFDASVWELVSPLSSGSVMVVAPLSVPGDVAGLARSGG